MEDKLKNRVDENRQEWDIHDVELYGLWDNIEAQLDENKAKAKKHQAYTWLKIAASIVLIIGVSWMVIKVNAKPEHQNGYALSELSPELAETEVYYASQINEKLEMISTANAEIDDVVLENLALLDSAYNDLKLDLKDNIDNEEVVGAMIENYRIKLQILEQVLGELNKKDHENERSDEISI